eukprot:COSAG01_NODE_505_length_16132_cov_49.751528_3_plen_99_part_00
MCGGSALSLASSCSSADAPLEGSPPPQLPSLHFVGVVLTPVIDLVTMTEAVPCSQRGWLGAAAAAASLPALTVLPTVAPSAGWPPHTAAAAAAAAGYG